MIRRYDVVVKVISQKGTCANEHKVGDEWVLGDKTPVGICSSAFNTLIPFHWVLAFGGSFPWENDPDVTTAACSDEENPVVFELRRMR